MRRRFRTPLLHVPSVGSLLVGVALVLSAGLSSQASAHSSPELVSGRHAGDGQPSSAPEADEAGVTIAAVELAADAMALGAAASPGDRLLMQGNAVLPEGDWVGEPLSSTTPLTETFHSYLPHLQTEGRQYIPLLFLPGPFQTPYPANGATGVSVNSFLTWQPSLAVANPVYSILLERDDPTPDQWVAGDLREREFDPYTFAAGATYFWQVQVIGGDGKVMRGPVWSFHTDTFEGDPDLNAMVLVPEGEYLMGCDPNNSGYTCFPWHGPLHAVWLDAFNFDKYEVTNREYRACVNAGVCNAPRKYGTHEDEPYFDTPEFDLYPVIFVSHWDAEDYCEWEGKRLPTEAEWEKAARGSIDTRPWPWGSEAWDCSRMNRCSGADDWAPARVDSYWRGQSPYGALNVAGNVFEWVKDYNDDFYPISPYYNPVNLVEPERGLYFSMRGGSYHDNWWYARTNHRQGGHWGDKPGDDAPLYRSFRSGFRCAQSIGN